MKLTRMARETARLAHATSSSNVATRSLRRFAYTAANAHEQPPSLDTDPQTSQENDRSGKRKRETTETPTVKTVKLEATEIRRSPRKAPKIANGDEDEEDATQTRPRKAARRPATKVKSPSGGGGGVVKVEAPAAWEEIYKTVASQRKRVLAPVDTMGCETLAEQDRSPADRRLQTLVSLMLSSQTKDTVTAAAMKNLQENLPGGFCLESLLRAAPEELNRLIEKVGFHNNKTKYIKATAEILRRSFGGDIPDTIEGLVSLPGVGPKMAYLCMSAAWGRDEGIGVDVHVHRITNLWGWHKTNTPEQTRAELESWLPREKWHDINHLLVGFGQTICLPVGRKCGECDLGMKGLCPSAVAYSPKKKRVKQKIAVEDGEAIKEEEAVVETDDKAAVVQIKSEDVGNIQAQLARASALEA
ncbi:related to DNA repair Ntg1 [Lecanosticta acicola]|uniref:Endonuclease III homolog n=1 Tax=Lecanosticta acicola TaxID=111012 RepID=A0AAI9EB66_9PEZI|nr:related to DNA repair Ntg1 [Lecanosticta acicola]